MYTLLISIVAKSNFIHDTIIQHQITQDTIFVSSKIISDKDWYQEPNNWIGISGVVIAVAAIIFSSILAKQNNKLNIKMQDIQVAHNALSVKPHISIFKTIDKDGFYIIQIINNGLGTALIFNMSFEYDGKVYKHFNDCWEAYKENPRNKCITSIHSKTFGITKDNPYGVSPGDSFDLCNLQFITNAYNCGSEKFYDIFFQPLKITVDYQSMYGDKFQLVD